MTVVNNLANNENAYAGSSKVTAALRSALDNLQCYPEEPEALKQAIATFYDLSAQQVTIGNGSENILELIVKAYLPQGTNAVMAQYTFLTIPLLIQSYRASAIIVPTIDYQNDLVAMLAAINQQTRVIFLVNPNNPTGTYIKTADFLAFMRAVPQHIIVVIDEAYAEFITTENYPHAHHYLAEFANMIVTRTFSKAYGLAGLRLGYALSSISIAEILNRARLPYNINALVEKAGIAALSDQAHLNNTSSKIHSGREQLAQGLTALNLTFLPSICNFITVDVGNAESVTAELRRAGIIVRSLAMYDLPRHIRVTIGTPEQMTCFLQTLAKVLRLDTPFLVESSASPGE